MERAVRRQPVEEPLAELPLVGDDGVPAERAEVVDRGDEAGQRLVRERPGLEAVPERLVRRGADLVGAPALEQLGPCEGEPQVRPVVLVRRGDQHVDTGSGDFDWPVRRVVDCIDPGEGAGVVRELGDAGHVDERPQRVRGPRERDHAGPVGELRGEIVQVERGVVADVGEADDEPEVVRQLEPG